MLTKHHYFNKFIKNIFDYLLTALISYSHATRKISRRNCTIDASKMRVEEVFEKCFTIKTMT